MGTVAIFGAGVMGDPALRPGRAGRSVDDLVITERRPERVEERRAKYGVRILDNTEQRRRPTRSSSSSSRRTWPASWRRSATTSGRETWSSASRPASRRTSSRAGCRRELGGPGHAEHPGSRRRGHGRTQPRPPLRRRAPGASELLRSCGKVVQIAEKHQDAVTAISGSGPAYIFYVVEAMIEAGVVLRLPRATATETRRPDALRRGHHDQGDRPAPDGAARAGHLPAAPRPRRCASSTTTRCGPPSSPRWRPRPNGRTSSRPAMAEPHLSLRRVDKDQLAHLPRRPAGIAAGHPVNLRQHVCRRVHLHRRALAGARAGQVVHVAGSAVTCRWGRRHRSGSPSRGEDETCLVGMWVAGARPPVEGGRRPGRPGAPRRTVRGWLG